MRRPSPPRFACAILLALAASASPQGDAPARHRATSPSFDALAASAARARDEGRREEALAAYRRALRQRPSWQEGRWALATLLYDMDRFREALEQFDRLVAARPDDGGALALRGLCLSRLGQNVAALEALLRARTLGIPSPEVRSVATFQTAVLLNHLGDPDAAFEILKPFALAGDDRPFVIEAFGLITLRLPWLPGAVPESGKEMVVLAGRGGYSLARGRADVVGRIAMEELVSRYPSTRNVHFALGMYLLADDPAAAIEAFGREIAAFPDHHVAMIQFALAELRRGRAEEALPVATEAVRLAPNVPAAHLAYGRALLATGSTEAAVSAFETAVRLAPENAPLRLALSRAYAEAGRPQEASRERAEFQKLQKAAGASISAEEAAPPAPETRSQEDTR